MYSSFQEDVDNYIVERYGKEALISLVPRYGFYTANEHEAVYATFKIYLETKRYEDISLFLLDCEEYSVQTLGLITRFIQATTYDGKYRIANQLLERICRKLINSQISTKDSLGPDKIKAAIEKHLKPSLLFFYDTMELFGRSSGESILSIYGELWREKLILSISLPYSLKRPSVNYGLETITLQEIINLWHEECDNFHLITRCRIFLNSMSVQGPKGIEIFSAEIKTFVSEVLIPASEKLNKSGEVKWLEELWLQSLEEINSYYWKCNQLLRETEHTREFVLSLFSLQLLVLRAQEDKRKIKVVEENRKFFISGEKSSLPKITDKRQISETVFWCLIDECIANEESSGLSRLEILEKKLLCFSASKMKDFQNVLDAKLDELYHFDLWRVACIILGDCSDDKFEYFRAWIILQGSKIFELAKNPKKFGLQITIDEPPYAEDLLYIASSVYEKRRNKVMNIKPFKPQNRDRGNTFKPDENLEELFPKVFAKWNSNFSTNLKS